LILTQIIRNCVHANLPSEREIYPSLKKLRLHPKKNKQNWLFMNKVRIFAYWTSLLTKKIVNMLLQKEKDPIWNTMFGWRATITSLETQHDRTSDARCSFKTIFVFICCLFCEQDSWVGNKVKSFLLSAEVS
jgi:hypothetical protein